MNQSEQVNELFAALAKAQGEMNHALKDSANPHYKSKYADIASVMEAIKEPLAKNNLAIIQTMDNKDGGVLITKLVHASGQWISSILPIINSKGDNHGLGSAITYARRFGAMAIVGCAPSEDSGKDDDGNESCRENPVALKKAAKELIEMIGKYPEDKQKIIWENWIARNGVELLMGLGLKLIDKNTNMYNKKFQEMTNNLPSEPPF